MKSFILIVLISISVFSNPRQRAEKRSQLAVEREKYNKENFDTSTQNSSEYIRKKRAQRKQQQKEYYIEKNCHGEREHINGKCLERCEGATIRIEDKCTPGCIEGFEFFQGRCLNPCGGKRRRSEQGICECEEGRFWDGTQCGNESNENSENDCQDNEIFSGVKCLKKINCRYGLDFIEGGNKVICSCPKGSYFSDKKNRCLCTSDDQIPTIKGECKVEYCKLNKTYEGRVHCICADNTKKFIGKKNKERFQCRPLCNLNKIYNKSKKNLCACPKGSKREFRKDNSFKCLKIEVP